MDFLTAISTMLSHRGTSTFMITASVQGRWLIVPSWLKINRLYQQLRLTDRFVRAKRNATHLIHPIN